MSGIRRTTRADVERALVGAEAQLARTQRRRRMLATTTLILSLVAAVGVAAAVALARGAEAALSSSVIVAAASLASFAIGLMVVARLRREVTAQERRMIEVVDWVREVFPLAAKRDDWTVAETESVRQRVARFPIVAR
jgi:hypothetical protein